MIEECGGKSQVTLSPTFLLSFWFLSVLSVFNYML
jgi:hypothetical protein